jgi:hypothetical protein
MQFCPIEDELEELMCWETQQERYIVMFGETLVGLTKEQKILEIQKKIALLENELQEYKRREDERKQIYLQRYAERQKAEDDAYQLECEKLQTQGLQPKLRYPRSPPMRFGIGGGIQDPDITSKLDIIARFQQFLHESSV